MKPNPNTIFFAPVHEVIKRLDSSQFDLIYIDPPFYREIDSPIDSLPYTTFRGYLEHIIFVVYQSKRLLKDTGSIIFRMDPISPFNSRLFLDRIFGKRNFRAEIVWEFPKHQRLSSTPRPNFDVVYFYSKSDGFTYHEPVVSLPELDIKRQYKHMDEKGHYKYWSLFSPVNHPDRNFEWKGFAPPKGQTWKYTRTQLNKLEESGQIEIWKNLPRRKVYLTEEARLASLGFVWGDNFPIRPEANKPDPKIQNIVSMSSNKNDTIFDPFMLPRSIPSFSAIERGWAGVALIQDEKLYEQPNKDEIKIIHEEKIEDRDVIGDNVLPSNICRIIESEAKAYEDSPSVVYPGQRYAVLVGINNYKDDIGNLSYCVNDINDLEIALVAAGYEVKTLHDNKEDDRLQPTRANIETEIENFAVGLKPEDTLYVHFSCHGTITDNGAVLITSDTRRQRISRSALYIADLIETMKVGQAKKLVLSLDVCHAGINMGRALVDQDFVSNVYNNAEGFALLAASTSSQAAFEIPKFEHGLFSYFLLDAIKGKADMDDDGRISVTDVKNYILNSVRQWNKTNSVRQDPTFRIEGIGEILMVSPKTD